MESVERLVRYVGEHTERWAERRPAAPVTMRYVKDELLDLVADVERECRDAAAAWREIGHAEGYSMGCDEGFASADDWMAQHEDAMAEHGWMRLPVDADGKPILPGETLFCGDYGPKEVYALLRLDGEWCFLDAGMNTFDVAGWTHYEEPTIEDVLRELVDECGRDDSGLRDEEIIERFAARLQLREE